MLGSDKATATAGLIGIAEWLGCRRKPCLLPEPQQLVCLARGLTAVLEAVHAAGGASCFAAADAAAAASLCNGLMQILHSVCRSRVTRAFAELAPMLLRDAAAEVHAGVPGLLQRTAAAGCLGIAFIQTDDSTKLCQADDEQGGSRLVPQLEDENLWQASLLPTIAAGSIV
jgi:hypothetical protein